MTNKAIFKTGATYTPIIDTSANSAARTYTMPDKAMTVAGADDVAAAEAAAKAYADALVGSRDQRVAILGDSIAAQNIVSTSTVFSKSGRGPVAWALAYLGQPWVLDTTDSYAVAGTSTDVVLSSQVPSLIAAVAAGKKYNRVFISTGTNDTASSRDIAQLKSEYQQIWAAVRSIGAIPVQMPILPRGTDGSLTTAKKQNQQLNSWFELQERLGIIEHPSISEMVADNSTAYGNALTTMMYDSGASNLHPNSLGAGYLGKRLYDYLSARGCARTPRYATQQSDVFDRTNNPYGHFLNSNPLLDGGTTAPTGWATSGGTWSKVSRTLENGQTRSDPQCALSASTTHKLFAQVTASGAWSASQLQPGDVVEARAWVEIASGVNILYATLEVVEDDGSGTQKFYYDLAVDTGGFKIPDGNHVLHLRTPPCTIRAYAVSGNASIKATVQVVTSSGASGTVTVKALELRRIA